MPDNKGKLTKDDEEKIDAWIAGKGDRMATCELCGTKDWTISDTVMCAVSFGQGTIMAGPLMPFVPLVCKECGHIRLLNAIKIGIVPLPDKENDGDEDSAIPSKKESPNG